MPWILLFCQDYRIINVRLPKNFKYRKKMSKTKNITLFLMLQVLQLHLMGATDPEALVKNLKNIEGTEKVDLLNEISSSYRDLSNNSEAISYGEQALQLAEEIQYPKGIIDAGNNLGSTYLLVNQLEEGIGKTRNALKLAEAENYKTGVATSYRNIGVYLIYTGQREKAVDTLKKALDILEELNDSTKYASALTALGVAYTQLGQTDNAIEAYKKSISYYTDDSSYEVAHSYLNLAAVYSSIVGNYEKALEYALASLKEFEKVGNNFKAAYAQIHIGIIYEELGDFDKPIEYYEKALNVFRESGNKYLIANAVNNLGEVYKKREEYTKAINYYNQTLELSKEINNVEGVAVALNNIGECDFYTGNYEAALDKYKRSYGILNELEDKHKLAISLNNLAAVNFKLNNFSDALDQAEQAAQLSKDVNAYDEEKKAYNTLYLVHSSRNNYKPALEYYKLFSDLRDSLTYKKLSEKVADLRGKYEAEQKEKEIALLTHDQKLAEAELKRQEVITYFLIAFAILAVVLVFVLYKKYVDRKETNGKLLESEKELKELNDTKDVFFSVIAHDLKGPFNSLLGISEMLYKDAEDFTSNEIKQICSELNTSSRNAYNLLENLLEWASSKTGKRIFDPQKFDLNDIVEQNISLYKKTASDKNIKLNFQPHENTIIKADINMVDSVVRNLINNAIKFTGDGGEVKVLTEKNNNHIALSVNDTGVGIEKKDIAKLFDLNRGFKGLGTNRETGTGLGLILAKEFIDKNNGTIEVSSEINKGTTFKVTFPTPNG